MVTRIILFGELPAPLQVSFIELEDIPLPIALLDMKTMTAAIAIAKKRQLVQVSRETLDALISEVEEKLPAPED